MEAPHGTPDFSSSQGSGSPDPASPSGTAGPLGWIFAALVVALISGWIAFSQHPRPDPYHQPDLFTRLKYPLERNAPRRLDAANGRINVLFARPDISRIWAAGEGGLLLSSEDEGRSWRQDSIVIDSTTTPPADAKTAVGSAESQSPVQQDRNQRAQADSTAVLPNSRQYQGPYRPDTTSSPTGRVPGNRIAGRISWDFIAVDFATDSVGMVLAHEAAFLTLDGGVTWRVLFDARLQAPLRAGHLIDSETAWLWDDQYQVWNWHITRAGPRWDLQPSEKAPRLGQLHFSTATFGAGVHSDHTLWVSEDGGLQWRLLPRRDRPGLAEVLFTQPPDEAVAIDTMGVLLAGSDSGTAWDTLAGDGRKFSSLGFRNGNLVGVSWDGRQLLRHERQDSLWLVSFGRPAIARLSFIDDRTGWLATEDGDVYRTADGAEHWTWVGQINGHPQQLRFFPGESGQALIRGPGNSTDSVLEMRSRDGGHTWVSSDRQVGSWRDLQLFAEVHGGVDGAFTVADSERYWFSSQGTLYRGNRSDGTETRDTSGSRLHIRTLSFAPGLTRGFGASVEGIVYTTTDTGKTWQDPAPYARWPAPWYYLSWILVGLLLTRALVPPPPPAPRESVADVLVSDRPIQQGDPDAIGLSRIAAGLAGFLRNRKTKPPLTIAVTGKWGKGKSSLMNLLRSELVAVGYRSVWFNAWHHQKEEHLLAALLESVQRDVVPPLLSWDGIEFRFRLLKLRSARYRRLLLVMVPAFAWSVGYLTTHGAETWTRFAALGDWLSNLVSGKPESGAPPGVLTGVAATILSIIGTAAGPAIAWMKGLKAFGASPASMMASMQGAFKLRDVQAQTSFRQQFMADFQEVTKALGARRLLIVIDDLDRCQPENVVEVLEAISFLVSAGDCIIVLGMDRDYVDGCVGLRFKEVAKELSKTTDGDEEGREVRRDFARHYLQKLVNIEVPVPEATSDQLRQVILPTPPPPVDRSGLELATRWVSRVALVALATLVTVSAFWYGRGPRPAKTPPAGVGTTVPASIASPGVPPSDQSRSNVITGVGWTIDRDTSTVNLLPGETTTPSQVIFWLGLVGIGVAAVVSLLRRPVPTTEDSPRFAEALDCWTPLVYLRTKTPREMKRFLNRVRLYAMQQHPPYAVETTGTKLKRLLARWLGRSRTKAAAQPQPKLAESKIDESVLVALTALDTYDPKMLDQLGDPKLMDDLPPGIRKEIKRLGQQLADAVEAYRKQARGLRID